MNRKNEHQPRTGEVVCVHVWEKRNDIESMGRPELKKCPRCHTSWDKTGFEPEVVVGKVRL